MTERQHEPRKEKGSHHQGAAHTGAQAIYTQTDSRVQAGRGTSSKIRDRIRSYAVLAWARDIRRGRAFCERRTGLPFSEEGETLTARSCNSFRLAFATLGGRVASWSSIIFVTTSVALSRADLFLAIGTTEYQQATRNTTYPPKCVSYSDTLSRPTHLARVLCEMHNHRDLSSQFWG